jgi:hypothetical protein
VSEESMKEGEGLKIDQRNEVARKLGAVGWSLFFIWIGVALLIKVDVGIGLLGVGVITLGAQAARKYFNLKLERFWVVVGFVFVIGGIWALFEPRLPLLPIVLIVAGLALLVSTFKGKGRMRK